APAEALHADGRHRDFHAPIDRARQPGFDAAHADAEQADALGVDVVAGLQVVDGPPDVPAGVVVERVLLLLARLRVPGTDDRLVVRLGPLGIGHAGAVVTGVDGHGDDVALGQVDQPLAEAVAVLAAAGAVQDDHRGELLCLFLGPDDQHRHPLGRAV